MNFPDYKGRNRWPVVLLLSAALGFALFIRLASFRNFINPDGGFFFYSVDAYEHLRRITLGVHSFPSIPAFDYYAGYPEGTGQLWSPLFDYVLSFVSLLFGGTRVAIETVSFFSNPFFASLTVLLIFAVAKKAFSSTAAGLAAAFLIAGNPGHISYSLPMNFDHHVFEPIAVLFLFSLPFFEENHRLSIKARLFAAFLLVLAIFLWRGSTLYWGATFLAVFIRSLVSNNKGLSLDYALSFIMASFIIALICVINPWGSASSVSFGIISWFHVIALLFFAFILLLFSTSKTKTTFSYALAGFAGAGILSLLVPQVRDFFSGIISGISFLRGAGDPWLESNSELHGVFSKYGFFYSASYLTAAWFAAPFGIALALKNWKKGGMTDKYLITLAAWSPLIFLGLIRRYTPIAGVLSSLAVAYLIAIAWESTVEFKKRGLLVACSALLLLPTFQHYAVTVSGSLPPHLTQGLYGKNGAFEWIKNNTPKTSWYHDPIQQPEYGILANWDLGAKINYLSERPALATAFGWETHGYYEQALFMVTDRPETAYSIVKNNRTGYVLLRAFENLKIDYSAARDGEAKNRLPQGISGDFNPHFSIYNRLMNADGSAYKTRDAFVPALGNYRLLFETDYLFQKKELPFPVSYYKVFEVVSGAVIRGKGKPNTVVSISIPLMSSRKRTFSFQDMAMTDKDGNFVFKVPYSTEGRQGETVPLGAYLISGLSTGDMQLKVTEAEVLEGLTVSGQNKPR